MGNRDAKSRIARSVGGVHSAKLHSSYSRVKAEPPVESRLGLTLYAPKGVITMMIIVIIIPP